MNKQSDTIILDFIRQTCAEKPHLLPKIIDYATQGVQDFANKQKDFGSKLGFAMTQVLEETNQDKFGCFTRKDLFEMTSPWLEGTKWYDDTKKKLDRDPSLGVPIFKIVE